jgi:hypothetical protein
MAAWMLQSNGGCRQRLFLCQFGLAGGMMKACARGRIGMKTQIVLWAVAGALVVAFWSFYISATHANPLGTGYNELHLQ